MNGQDCEAHAALRKKYLIETDELEQLMNTNAANLKLVNASWYMPNQGVDVKEAHKAKRITKDTLLYDHSRFADPNGKFPSTLPTVEHFKSCMMELGL